MRNGLVLAVSIVSALVLAGFGAEAAARSSFFLGPEPVAVVAFLTVGIALPQYVIYRRDGEASRLGLAALSVTGAAGAVLAGGLQFALYGTRFHANLLLLFQLLVVGALLGAVVRAFLAGYRERTA